MEVVGAGSYGYGEDLIGDLDLWLVHTMVQAEYLAFFGRLMDKMDRGGHVLHHKDSPIKDMRKCKALPPPFTSADNHLFSLTDHGIFSLLLNDQLEPIVISLDIKSLHPTQKRSLEVDREIFLKAMRGKKSMTLKEAMVSVDQDSSLIRTIHFFSALQSFSEEIRLREYM